MNASADSLRTLIQDWAEQETQRQITSLTPALLRCKARLAQEDGRRLRLRRLRTFLLVPPAVLLALWLVAGLGTVGALLQNLLALSSAPLGTLLTVVALVAMAGPAMALD